MTILDVLQGSLEWTEIENEFLKTSPKAFITKVERIQNKILWATFQTQVKNYSIRNNGRKPCIKMLYHGTRGTPPAMIAESGFDMRFSKDGLWGQAIYFAVKSSYSHKYHHPENGLK